MSKPRVILDPAFRAIGEIFDQQTLKRLNDMAQIVWGRNEPMPTADLIAEIPTADVVVFGEWRHGREGLDAAGDRLVALLEVAGGHEHPHLDYREALRRGINVGSCAPAFGPVVAEMGLALALSAARGVVAADRDMRHRREMWLHEGNRRNTTLLSSTVGFVGCGGISRHLQAMLEPFAVHILGYDPPLPRSILDARGIERSDLIPMFQRADVIFVLAAPTPTNRHLVGAELMEHLTSAQTLVVLSRASLVDFDAMVELAGKRGFRLATDVYPHEPVGEAHPVRDSAQSVIVPHLAGALPVALRAIGTSVVDDLEAIFAGRQPSRMQYLTAKNAAALRQTGRRRSG